jgi:hypothetical protein
MLSNGLRNKTGARGKLDSLESVTMREVSGVSLHVVPKVWPVSFHGKVFQAKYSHLTEGMSDYYRDRVRHGGILSNNFIAFWWNRQVVSYQYGLEGRSKPREGLIGGKSGQWGEETLEGNLTAEELRVNRQDQTIDTAKYKFRDEDYFTSKEYRLEDIEVPILSVANWVPPSTLCSG